MEVQLSALIEKIKKEGIEEVEVQSVKIVADAEKKAAAIITDAEKRAADLRESSKRDAKKAELAGKEAIKQASRDLILSLKGEIVKLFDSILKDGVQDTLSGAVLEKVIMTVLEAWNKDEVKDLVVAVSEKDWGNIEKGLKGSLADMAKKGIEFKPLVDIAAGFRVEMKDGSAFYDFSDEEVVEILSGYLNPKIAEVLK